MKNKQTNKQTLNLLFKIFLKKNVFKTIILLLVLVFLISSCEDNEEIVIEQDDYSISLEKATVVAIKFNPNFVKSKTKHKSRNKKIKSSKTFFTKNNRTSFYVFNYEEGGFIVVSADERMHPVIAYSEVNSFKTDKNKIPPNVNLWISSVNNTLENLYIDNLTLNKISSRQWDKYFVAYKEPPSGGCEDETIVKGPLLSTTWNQRCSFNDLLPSLSCGPCGHAYSGCVPTAMAQIMKFHEFPNNYNWSNMPDAYGTNDTQLLISDIFNSVVDKHTCKGTTVYSHHMDNVVLSFENVFNYSTSASLGSYNYNTVQNEIDNNRPVLMTGVEPGGDEGHAWVCDGYRETLICFEGGGGNTFLKFYMNWGWLNTEFNGWYSFDDFTPDIYNFNDNKQIIFNIKP